MDAWDFQEQGTAGPPQGNDLASQWGAALNDPGFRTGLMQFGLQMMQPMGFGQTPAGHFAQSIGAGGEAVARNEKLDIAKTEADSKQELRSSQAQNAETRANAAVQNAQSQADLRRATATTRHAQAELANARVRDLEIKSALYPQDLEIKQALVKARTDAATVNAQAAADNAATGARRADTYEKDVDSRVEDRGNKFGLSQAVQRSRETQNDVKNAAELRKSYDKFVSDTTKNNTQRKLLDPTDSGTPIPPFQDWAQSRTGVRPYSNGDAPPAAYPNARKAADGNWYVDDPNRPGKYMKVQ